MTERVDHVKMAEVTLAELAAMALAPEALTAAGAIVQAHVLLALVEQARIANLIALLKDTFASHQALEALSDVATAQSGQLISLRPDIAAALGIETGAGDE